MDTFRFLVRKLFSRKFGLALTAVVVAMQHHAWWAAVTAASTYVIAEGAADVKSRKSEQPADTATKG